MKTANTRKISLLELCKQQVHKAAVQQKEQGFTLIELLLVIGIIAILASIVILAINPTANIQSAQTSAAVKQARAVQNAIVQHVIDHGAAPDGIGGTPLMLCSPGFEVIDGCEINLEDELASAVDSDYAFISNIPVSANHETLGLPAYDSGFRVSFDGMRYFVQPVTDVTNPTVVSFFPADDTNDLDWSTPLNATLTFDEPVQIGSGNIEYYSVFGLEETLAVTDSRIVVSGSTVTISNLTTNPLTDYYIRIDATAITDLAGNSYTGIADNTTWNFTTTGM